MSNVLKVSLQTTIHSLADRGWSQRRIARELGINRETVGRYLRLADSAKPAISTPGSEDGTESKPAILTPGLEGKPEAKPAISTAGKNSGRKSQSEPLAEVMPCRPGKPEHKGKVERGVAYLRNNALKQMKTFSCDIAKAASPTSASTVRQ